MPYEIQANSRQPALIIYVLDVSASMSITMAGRRRIDLVNEALGIALQQMVFRSTKGGKVQPRYRLAMFAYSDHVFDLLPGIKTIDQVVSLGAPELSTMRSTDTAKAFLEVEKLLMTDLPNNQNCPAPLVCHMTDGEYTGANPEPIIRRIREMRNQDGNVLVENIFISDKLLDEPIREIKNWGGILPDTRLGNEYARRLRDMSSPLPESYQVLLREGGYNLSQDALMMLPGTSPELIELGFVMSTATKVA